MLSVLHEFALRPALWKLTLCSVCIIPFLPRTRLFFSCLMTLVVDIVLPAVDTYQPPALFFYRHAPEPVDVEYTQSVTVSHRQLQEDLPAEFERAIQLQEKIKQREAAKFQTTQALVPKMDKTHSHQPAPQTHLSQQQQQQQQHHQQAASHSHTTNKRPASAHPTYQHEAQQQQEQQRQVSFFPQPLPSSSSATKVRPATAHRSKSPAKGASKQALPPSTPASHSSATSNAQNALDLHSKRDWDSSVYVPPKPLPPPRLRSELDERNFAFLPPKSQYNNKSW